MAPKKICVVGGGASGVSLLWALTSNELTRPNVELTLLHNDAEVGGHSHTLYPVLKGKPYPVDIGVQYVCELLYPNTIKMLARPEFAGVTLTPSQINLGAAFAPTLNWGNFPAYQTGDRFSRLYTPQNQASAKKFVNDILMSVDNGTFSQTMGAYLPTSGLSKDFVSYMLMPYLSVLNGYGDDKQLLEAQFSDLFVLFVDLSTKHIPGPLAAFLQPGLGWLRFTNGSASWINAMAGFATTYGAKILTSTSADAVWPDPSGTGVWVQWGNAESPAEHAEQFDTVVLTTDMDSNYALLNNDRNPNFATQKRYIAPSVFQLNPGSCYIHQDINVLAPWLRDQQEILQFTALAPPPPGSSLPYDMAQSYSTWLVQNMVSGLPEPVYVSMYGGYNPPTVPNPAKLLGDPIQWKHGRFLGSMMLDAKRQVHNIQGLGNTWFAGNNTTTDSEEGALLSAMIIAGRICPEWYYPFGAINTEDAYAFGWYELMKNEFMFPTSPGLERAIYEMVVRTMIDMKA